jgi:hypothetical protein
MSARATQHSVAGYTVWLSKNKSKVHLYKTATSPLRNTVKEMEPVSFTELLLEKSLKYPPVDRGGSVGQDEVTVAKSCRLLTRPVNHQF